MMVCRRLLALGTVAVLIGCTSLYKAAPVLDSRTDKEKETASFATCSGGPSEHWDLGTGRLEDISAREPNFYSFRDPASYTNRARWYRLKHAVLPIGLTLNYRPTNGFAFIEFESRSKVPEQVFAFATKNRGIGILLAPASCPHVFVEEECVGGDVVTRVRTDGTLPCYMGISGKLAIRGIGIPEGSEIAPGEVVWVEGHPGNGVAPQLSYGERTLFAEAIPVDRFGRTTPAVLLGLAQFADDREVFRGFKTLNPKWATPNIADEVKRSRLLRLNERLTSDDLLDVYESMYLNPEFPGHREVVRVLENKLFAEFNGVLESKPSEFGFWRGVQLLDRSQDSARLDVQGFVAKYGPLIADGHFKGEPEKERAIENEFYRRWPDDPFSKKLVAKRNKEIAETQAIADAERKEEEAREKREAADDLARCSARCEHKCMSPIYRDKALCRQGCKNVECLENECVGFCQADCSTWAKSGQPGCVSACRQGRCGG